jgi:hypothetical protein
MSHKRIEPTYSTRPLAADSWDDFAELVEANNGAWGGCWCMGFHPEGLGDRSSATRNRNLKQAHVRHGTVHQLLVYDGGKCVGWCQYGSPAELPRIKNPKAVTTAELLGFLRSQRRGTGKVVGISDGSSEVVVAGCGRVSPRPPAPTRLQELSGGGSSHAMMRARVDRHYSCTSGQIRDALNEHAEYRRLWRQRPLLIGRVTSPEHLRTSLRSYKARRPVRHFGDAPGLRMPSSYWAAASRGRPFADRLAR